MNSARTRAKVTVKTRLLSAAEFQRLADVPRGRVVQEHPQFTNRAGLLDPGPAQGSCNRALERSTMNVAQALGVDQDMTIRCR
jgi:hypothetical protein